ncbi:hypothetical protein GX48_03411 [Paracoccidioides brasiliensis]|nr:hypothetical protein GX48_03411 [Paracoccidioides brasiliensis]
MFAVRGGHPQLHLRGLARFAQEYPNRPLNGYLKLNFVDKPDDPTPGRSSVVSSLFKILAEHHHAQLARFIKLHG